MLYVTRALAQVCMMWVIMWVAATFDGFQQYNIMFFTGAVMIAIAGGALVFLKEGEVRVTDETEGFTKQLD